MPRQCAWPIRTPVWQSPARQQIVIRIDDTRSDPRWPGYMAEARNNGVLSQLCVPLRADERALGTLSLYAGSPSAFTDGPRAPHARTPWSPSTRQ